MSHVFFLHFIYYCSESRKAIALSLPYVLTLTLSLSQNALGPTQPRAGVKSPEDPEFLNMTETKFERLANRFRGKNGLS